MHETHSAHFIGQIDTFETTAEETQIVGWLVDTTLQKYSAEDIQILDAEHFSPVSNAIQLQERPDVIEFFKTQHPLYLNSGFIIRFSGHRAAWLVVKGEPVLWIKDHPFAALTCDDVIHPNLRSQLDLIVVDNFYANPDLVRAYALSQTFYENESYHKGRRTQLSYIPNWIPEAFSRLVNKQVSEFIGASGIFQYCVAKDSVVYHYDTQEYAAMVYLTPDAPLQTGTRTYRSLRTGLRTAATDEDAERLNKPRSVLDSESFNGNNFYDRYNLELVDSVANVYNRLVIFNARTLHAASGYFGDAKENGRLFHLYFFNCAS